MRKHSDHDKFFLLLTVLIAATVAIAVFSITPSGHKHSILDIKRIAEDNGLFTVLSNEHDLIKGAIRYRQVTISRRALTDDDLERLAVTNRNHPAWRETIVVMLQTPPNVAKVIDPPPDDTVEDYWIYGDAQLIKSVKSLLAADSRRP